MNTLKKNMITVLALAVVGKVGTDRWFSRRICKVNESFFIKQSVSDKKQGGKNKNIANIRYFPVENCVIVTIGKK